jgi:hypothetical protein
MPWLLQSKLLKMIKLKDLLESRLNSEWDKKYPVAGHVVDGREVLPNVDNMSSIGASIGDDYTILKGIREVSMSEFAVSGRDHTVFGDNKITKLTQIIEHSKKTSPLIVVIDDEGPYILEGWHRISALKRLGAKSFPALVVVDHGDS